MAFIYKMAQMQFTCTKKTFKYIQCMCEQHLCDLHTSTKSHQNTRWLKDIEQKYWSEKMLGCTWHLLWYFVMQHFWGHRTVCWSFIWIRNVKSPQNIGHQNWCHIAQHLFFSLFPSELSFLARLQLKKKNKKTLSHKAAALAGLLWDSFSCLME